MRVNCTLDLREFDAAMRDYLALTHSKTLPEILNTKAFAIAAGALANTPRAKREAIEKLGLHSSFVSSKTGKTVKTRQFVLEDETAIFNFAGAMKKEGFNLQSKFASRQEILDAARKWIASKLRAIGFIASGWLPAIRRLLPLVVSGTKSIKIVGVAQFGKPKGRAVPAVAGWRPEVIIENSAGYSKSASKKTIDLPAIAKEKMTFAFQKAFDAETASMADYMAKRMQADADKFKPRK